MYVNSRDQTERSVSIYSALVQIYLEYCAQFEIPQNKKHIKLLERIQRRVMRMVKGLEGKLYEEPLWSVGFFRLEETEKKPHCNLKHPCEADKGHFALGISDST